jgi:uncharacterized protein
MPAEVTVAVHAGAVHLPSVGTIRLDGARGGLAVLSTSGDDITVRGGATRRVVEVTSRRPAEGWLPTRQLDCPGLDVVLDDNDPFRSRLGQPAEAVTAPAYERMGHLLGAALTVVGRQTPGYLDSITHALKVLTPLRADPLGRQRSGSSRDSYGAVGVGPVPDGDALAVLLIHEVQHLKFAAVADLCDLVEAEDRTRIRVGWRPDPRPVEAALTGAYAHMAVADVWRARSGAGASSGAAPAERFHHYRDMVISVINAIIHTSALTPDGRRFAETMLHTVESWAATEAL